LHSVPTEVGTNKLLVFASWLACFLKRAISTAMRFPSLYMCVVLLALLAVLVGGVEDDASLESSALAGEATAAQAMAGSAQVAALGEGLTQARTVDGTRRLFSTIAEFMKTKPDQEALAKFHGIFIAAIKKDAQKAGNKATSQPSRPCKATMKKKGAVPKKHKKVAAGQSVARGGKWWSLNDTCGMTKKEIATVETGLTCQPGVGIRRQVISGAKPHHPPLASDPCPFLLTLCEHPSAL